MNRRLFLRTLTAATATSAGAIAAIGCRSTGPADVLPAPGSAGNPGAATLRVMTWNLHHGEGVDGRIDLARIAAVVRDARPDLVALQEVDRNARRTGNVDQAAEYLRLTGLSGWYGAAMPFQGGEYGQVLLARWPLLEPRIVRLPGSPGREPRIAVTALVEVPGHGRVRWAGLHLDATRADNDRWDQAGALLGHFAPDGVPTLLGGDFNDTPGSRVMRRLLGGDGAPAWQDTAGAMAAPTIPAEAPASRIDYLLASPGNPWTSVESRVLPEAAASDHRPLLAVLRWNH